MEVREEGREGSKETKTYRVFVNTALKTLFHV